MANTVYANKVLEAKAKDLLTTSVNTRIPANNNANNFFISTYLRFI